LLSASNSNISSLFSLVSAQRSSLSSTHPDPLVQLNQSTVGVGGTDPFNPASPTYAALLLVQGFRTDGSVAPPRFDGSVSLGGPFLRAVGSQLSMSADAIGVFDGGQLTAGSPTVAVITLDNSRLAAGSSAFTGDVIQVERVGGRDGATRPKATLRGPLLNAANGSTLNVTGGFVAAADGGQVVVTGSGAIGTLVMLQGGSHTVATDRPMFDLLGRTSNGNTDQPLQHGGTLLETNGATIGDVSAAQRFLRVNNAVFDQSLFEASLPLLKASNGSLIRTATNAIDLSAARLTTLGDVIQLNASRFDVVSGALANVAGGSSFRVSGNLVTLANGSTLNLLNGAVLNVSGNSTADIGKALIGFSGAGNVVNITNNLCAAGCSTIGGLRVRLDGTPAGNVAINSPITGQGTVNLSPNAAHLAVSGGASHVTIGPR